LLSNLNQLPAYISLTLADPGGGGAKLTHPAARFLCDSWATCFWFAIRVHQLV